MIQFGPHSRKEERKKVFCGHVSYRIELICVWGPASFSTSINIFGFLVVYGLFSESLYTSPYSSLGSFVLHLSSLSIPPLSFCFISLSLHVYIIVSLSLLPFPFSCDFDSSASLRVQI